MADPCPWPQTNQQSNQTGAKTGATVHISTVPAQANVAVSELKEMMDECHQKRCVEKIN